MLLEMKKLHLCSKFGAIMFISVDFSILWQTGEENYTIGVAEPVGEFGGDQGGSGGQGTGFE